MSRFFITCAKGLEGLLLDELRQLGFEDAKETRAGVSLTASFMEGCRICLWSRLASRVLLELGEFAGEKDVYQATSQIDWSEIFTEDKTLSVQAIASGVEGHSLFMAQRAKDAIVDQLREKNGYRPSVDIQQADIRIHVLVRASGIQISLDLYGAPLHQRGYRQLTGSAPIKENLAAAILVRAGWPKLVAERPEGKQLTLIDPMCGSGTLLMEGLLMAADIAPGLKWRDYWGFSALPEFDSQQWQQMLADARQRMVSGMEDLPQFHGFDLSKKVIGGAKDAASAAGFARLMKFEHLALADQPAPDESAAGLLICNLPYGERLGEDAEIETLYQQLGDTLKRDYVGWQASVLLSNAGLGKAFGIQSDRRYKLYNGSLECQLLNMDLKDENFRQVFTQRMHPALWRSCRKDFQPTPHSEMFGNRLKKNRRKLSNWIKRENINAYRLYDADLPEYAAAIDIYNDHLLIQEYLAPSSVDENAARQRFSDILWHLQKQLNIAPENIHIRVRQKEKGAGQPIHQENGAANIVVEEGQAKLVVNLEDNLDSGLFLDHRPMRRHLSSIVKGKRFLNLFASTATASVHTALAGASSSLTLNMSKYYLTWAEDNFRLNQISTLKHPVRRVDCYQWLDSKEKEGEFDLIFMDPPNFFNSSRMDRSLDVTKDHPWLIDRAMARLAAGGQLYFSNNRRDFKMSDEVKEKYQVQNLDSKMLPPDYERNPKIHNCWLIETK